MKIIEEEDYSSELLEIHLNKLEAGQPITLSLETINDEDEPTFRNLVAAIYERLELKAKKEGCLTDFERKYLQFKLAYCPGLR